MARVFISYKRADKDLVFPIKDKIEATTGEECWIAIDDIDSIESEAQFVNVVLQTIGDAEVFLFMYSKQYAQIANHEKEWTIREINCAKALGKQIFFINLDGTPLADWLKIKYGDIQQLDFASGTSLFELIVQIKNARKLYYSPQSIEDPMPNIGLMDSTDYGPMENGSEYITYEAKCNDNSRECYSSAGGAYCGAIIGGVIGSLVGSISGLFHGIHKNPDYYDVFASLFSSTEVKRKSHLLVQIFLHLYEETEIVKSFAKESQKDAERRDYIPLQCKLKKGDKVDITMNIYGEDLLMSQRKGVVWQGSFAKCSFDYFVPQNIGVEELSCLAMLSVNGVPVGEMRFITQIVDSPRQLNPEIIAHKYEKVFISYSHKDEQKVRFLHEGLELGDIPHFFDRKYLKTGDVFPQVIQDYINSADLFILCWSENASKSEYVQRERQQALARAFPQVKPEQAAKLRIYPMSIEPHAELPSDMRAYYHFGKI